MGIQFLSLTASFEVNWHPDSSEMVKFLVYFTKIPIFEDIRIQFLILALGMPVVLSIIILVCFKSIFVVLKELLTLFSIIGLSYGIYGYLNDLQYAYQLITICGVLVLIFSLEFVVKGLLNCRKSRIQDTNSLKSQDDSSDQELHHKAIWKQIRNSVLIAVIIGLSLLGYFTNQLNSYYMGVITVIALFLCYNVISNLFLKGRKFNTKLNYFFRLHIIKVILFILNLMYIPITLFCLQFMIPSKFIPYQDNPCLDSQLLKFKMPFAPYHYSSQQCLNTFSNQTLSKLSTGSLLNYTEDRFFQSDPTLSYYSETIYYYLPGSVLFAFFISLGMPFLYYKLVTVCNKMIQLMPLKPIPEEIDEWHVKSFVSKNCCSSLYKGLKEKQKDFKLVMLAYRLLIVSVIAFTYTANIKNDAFVFIIITFVHLIGLICSIYFKPFISTSHNLLLIAMQLINVVLAGITGLLAFQVELPSIIFTILPFLFIGIPFLLCSIGGAIDIFYYRKRKKNPKYASLDVFVELTTEQLLESDMVMDKLLQTPIAGYFTIIMLLGLVGMIVCYYGTTRLQYTYKLAQGRATSNFEKGLVRMNNYDQFNGPFRSCSEISELLKTCTCVDMHLTVTNTTEAWKCEHLSFNDELVILQRINADFKESYHLESLSIRPWCSNQFNMDKLDSNFTLKAPIDDEFKRYWEKTC